MPPQHRAPAPTTELLLVEIPTHLERTSAIFVVAVWVLCAGLAGFATMQWRVPWFIAIPPVIPIGFFALTTEAATDLTVVGLGMVAAWCRRRLGYRAAHEWVAVYAHYWKLTKYPVWRTQCVRFWRSLQRRTRSFQTRLLKAIRWSASRASSWASAFRSNLLAMRASWTRRVGPGLKLPR